MCCKSFLKQACLGAFLGLLSTGTNATFFTAFPGNSAASVDFSNSGNTLFAILTKMCSAGLLVPSDVLEAVLFDISGYLTLNSALLTPGGSIFYNPEGQTAEGAASAGEDDQAGFNTDNGAGKQRLSLSDLDNFNSFPSPRGNNSAEPSNTLESLQYRARRMRAYRPPLWPSNGVLYSLQYGVFSAGINKTTSHYGGNMKPYGLLKNSVTYTLTGMSAGEVLSGAYFQYSTALNESGYAGNCVISGYCQPLTIKEAPDSEADSLWLLDALRNGYWVFVRWIFTVFGINEQ